MRMSLSSRAYGSALALCFVALSVTLAPGTPALASSSTCPNEALRAESNVNPVTGTPFSASLPECRAYELVSTAAKNDSNVTEPVPANIGEPDVWVTADGDSALWLTGGFTVYGETAKNGFSDVFGATRSATGWSQSAALAIPGSAPTYTKAVAVSSDLSTVLLTRSEELNYSSSTEVVERRPDGSYEKIASGLPNTANSPLPAEVSEDGARTFFESKAQLAGDTHIAARQLYEWTPAGGLHVFAVDSEGHPTSPCGAVLASLPTNSTRSTSRDLSPDGSRAVFLSPDPALTGEEVPEECRLGPVVSGRKSYVSDLYVREDDSTTVDISRPPAGLPDYGASYVGATTDGSEVFFITRNRLTPDKATTLPDLYEYDVETRTLTRLSVGPPSYDEANVGSAVVSEDGSHVYFEATGQLVPGAGAAYPEGSSTTNLYLYTAGSVHFIVTVSNSGADGFSSVEFEPQTITGLTEFAWVTPDGGDLLFYSAARLTGYDNEAHFELYRYDAASSTISCVSCSPLDAPPGLTPPLIRSTTPGFPSFVSEDQLHAISTDGSTVFFDSAERLLPAAANARDGEHERVYDVYEWHDGGLSLISSGASPYSDWLYNASASGSDVFFETRDQLVPEDGEEAYDWYDARVEGGFPAPAAAAPCASLATCRSMLATPPVPIAPASVSVSGSGNLAPVAEAPPAPIKPKPLTRAQQLAKALKACKAKKNKKKRATCETQARKQYGPPHKAKKSAKRGGRS
ncbi:MAG: hypothetical protein ABSB69_04625 [Solirubrobacteraceae bacterium]